MKVLWKSSSHSAMLIAILSLHFNFKNTSTLNCCLVSYLYTIINVKVFLRYYILKYLGFFKEHVSMIFFKNSFDTYLSRSHAQKLYNRYLTSLCTLWQKQNFPQNAPFLYDSTLKKFIKFMRHRLIAILYSQSYFKNRPTLDWCLVSYLYIIIDVKVFLRYDILKYLGFFKKHVFMIFLKNLFDTNLSRSHA